MTYAGDALGNALTCLIGAASVAGARSVRWASLDMVGECHRMRIVIAGEAAGRIAERLTRDLGEHEFTVPGLLVADISAELVRARTGIAILEVQALTFAEPPSACVSPGRTPGSDRPARGEALPARSRTVRGAGARRDPKVPIPGAPSVP